jgi:UDP-N-acetylmuramate dehydrogenase
MKFCKNISLKSYNTFGVDVRANAMVELESTAEIIEFVRNRPEIGEKIFVLNGGSNVLFTFDFKGLIIRINNPGIVIKEETKDGALIEAGAGENWDALVRFCINSGLYGLENLSLIPGNVGAAPIQNIGAYGVEQKDHFHSLQAIARDTGEIRTFSYKDCKFGYRDSVFKNDLKEKFIILSVEYKLSKSPAIKIDYGAIKTELQNMVTKDISPADVAAAVCNIRRSKLPDPALTGNAGSFFKNPVVSLGKFQELKEKFPQIVSFQQKDGGYKIAAGWMIEQLGWKGMRRGDAGVCQTQALVLINYGHAAGWQIAKLAKDINLSVEKKFGVSLEYEVNIV